MINKLKKFLWVTVLIVILLPFKVQASIIDVTGHWAEEVILEWTEKGLANGYPDGTFKPNNSISRAEFMKLVNNAFRYTEEEEINYTDVSENQWYFSTVKSAKAAGYINGYDDGTMRPNNPITREEVATIIARIMNLEANEDGIEEFKDKDNIVWSKGYVGVVVKEGYMKGYPDETFKPQRYITRAEAVYALNNIIGENDSKIVQAIAKQDFFGITYIHVTLRKGVEPSEVKANGEHLTYDNSDGKWKGSALDMEIGDAVEITVLENGVEETLIITVKDM